MARDDALRALFTDTAASSGGALTFRVTTSALLAQEFGLMLARSTNPVYVFGISGASGERLTCVAFTLALDGIRRPATRAEALGRSLAYSEGQLFDLNPFLLVYDYVGKRLLAAPAIDLFGAFAEYVSHNALPYTESASFSLTPNFQYSTINMYAELRTPTVWAASTDQDDLSDDLVAFLRRVAEETAVRRTEVPAIVEAIKTRISAAPNELETSGDTEAALTLGGPETDYAYLEPRDDEVQVEDRLWRIILAAIESSAAVILVGPPGTGKSMLVRKAIGTISEYRQVDGQPGIKRPLWATPDESWTFRELVGGETVAGGDIVFRPGLVLRAIEENRWLVLDEANRGDLDRIFGALLTWLAGEDVTVGVESSAADAKLIELGRTSGESRVEVVEGIGRRGTIRYLAGEDWKLLGTYNALDAQRVFRIGAALGRRFVRVPIPPIPPSLFNQVLERRAGDLPDELRIKIGLLYDAHYQEEVTRLGQALFLSMCSYLRYAVQPHVSGSSVGEGSTDTTTPGTAEQLSLDPPPEPGTSGDSGFEATAAAGGDNPITAQGSMGSILSEAYVLNLGTFLAQLEGPDFDQLAHRIKASSALSQKEVEWVSEMMRALA